jgi:pyruvate/2-oxoglutarate dehydrogenase complex dihydrolipoamide dehydrogenase (E3) component
VQGGTDEIVGATIVASRAGEIINEVTLAMKQKIGLNGIGRNIHSYPMTGESMDEIVGATIVASRAGEIINEVTLAMKHKIGPVCSGTFKHGSAFILYCNVGNDSVVESE